MKATETTLAAMLDGNVEYVIPQFQRAYAWKKEEQWSPLWDDITNTANAIAAAKSVAEVPPHFMGPLVIQERSAHPDGRPPGYIVVDGQQRMTTMLVLLKAVGDAAGEFGISDLAEKFLIRIWNEIGHGIKTPKVRHANSRERIALLEVLRGFADTDAHSRIADCYAFFNDSAVDYLRKGEDRWERCRALLVTLDEKMQTATLTLDPVEQPNVVFETLNGRAAKLKESELVKNTIMYEGGVVEDETRAEVLWSKSFEDDFWREEKSGESTMLDIFLSDWLTARLERRITPGRVSAEFRAYLQNMKANRRNVQYLTDRLNHAARIYRDVMNDNFAESMPSSQRMLDMSISAVMPVILWLWDWDNSTDRRERQATLRTIEGYVVRRILAGLNVGGTLMNTLVTVLTHLRNATEQAQSHREAVSSMLANVPGDSARWPKDREISEGLTQMPHHMSATRRDVVLLALEDRLRRDNGKPPLDFKPQATLLMPNNEAGLTHYLPPGRLTESRKNRLRERVGYLGNLTLTKKRLTQKEQNLPWPEKLQILQNHSEIEMTKLILVDADEQWTEHAIEERSNMMAELAIKTWPYPTE